MDILNQQSVPIVLIGGFPDSQLSSLLTKITTDNSMEPHFSNENYEQFEWKIDTKYYAAKVALLVMKTFYASQLQKSILERIQALILYFDNNNKHGLEYARKMITILLEQKIDVLILCCDNYCDELNYAISEETALQWCVKHNFELIQLNSEIEEENNTDHRLFQALTATHWNNLQLKNTSKDKPEQLHVEQDKLSQTTENLTDEETFYELLFNLNNFKTEVQKLTGTERKQAAENITLRFWNALGGSDDEFNHI